MCTFMFQDFFLASTLSNRRYLFVNTHHTISLTVTCLSCYCTAIAYTSLQCPTPLAGTNHRLILPFWDINLLGTKRATLCCLMAAVWLREAFFYYYIQLLSLHLATSPTSLCWCGGDCGSEWTKARLSDPLYSLSSPVRLKVEEPGGGEMELAHREPWLPVVATALLTERARDLLK